MQRVQVPVVLLTVVFACGPEPTSPGQSETDTGGSSAPGTTSPTTGDSAASSGTGESGSVDGEAACRSTCEAQLASGCSLHADVEACAASCTAVLDAAGGWCLEQNAALLWCQAEGGYECIDGIATEVAACVGEGADFAECYGTRGCEGFCRDVTMQGCDTDDRDCLADCIAFGDHFEGCGARLNVLRNCQTTQEGSVCAPGGVLCKEASVDVATCIAAETGEVCPGWCFMHAERGCSSPKCEPVCDLRIADPNCGGEFRTLVDCGLSVGDLTCVEGHLGGDRDSCRDEQAAYDACLGL